MAESKRYYESHITVDPVMDDDRRSQAAIVASCSGFKLAKLVMLKDGSPHTGDTFMTCRSKNLESIKTRTRTAVQQLEREGFPVRRWKIEDTLFDSKSGDNLNSLRDEPDSNETDIRIMKVISDYLPWDGSWSGDTKEALKPDQNFFDDLGCDSLDIIELMLAVEEEFNITIDDGEEPNIKTVQDLVTVTRKAMQDGSRA